MKKLFVCIAVMALCGMVMTSCEKEEKNLKTISYKANTETDAKTHLDGNSLKWDNAESICVSGYVLTATEVSDDGTSATFSCLSSTCPEAGLQKAYYPAANYVSEGVMTLPATQIYNAEKGLVGFPMYAQFEEAPSDAEGMHVHPIQFKNLCGMVSLNLQAAKSISSISVFTDKAVNGTFSVEAAGDAWQLNAGTATNDEQKTITLECGNVDITSGATFNIYLPVGSYQTFDMVITATDGTSCVKSLKEGGVLNVLRSDRTTLNFGTNLTFVEPIRYTTSDGSNLSNKMMEINNNPVAHTTTPKCVITREGNVWVANYAAPIQRIKSYTFSSTKLTSVVIPSTVTVIETSAFAICNGLTSIVIPNSVTEIMGSVFYSCSHLANVTIGSNVTSIGTSAFNYCAALENVTCYATNPPALELTTFDNTNSTMILHVPAGRVSAYTGSDWNTPFNGRIQ